MPQQDHVAAVMYLAQHTYRVRCFSLHSRLDPWCRVKIPVTEGSINHLNLSPRVLEVNDILTMSCSSLINVDPSSDSRDMRSHAPTPIQGSAPLTPQPSGVHPSRMLNFDGPRGPPPPPLQTDISGAPSGPRGSGRTPLPSPSTSRGGPPTGPAGGERHVRRQDSRNQLGAINNLLSQGGGQNQNLPPGGPPPPERSVERSQGERSHRRDERRSREGEHKGEDRSREKRDSSRRDRESRGGEREGGRESSHRERSDRDRRDDRRKDDRERERGEKRSRDPKDQPHGETKRSRH